MGTSTSTHSTRDHQGYGTGNYSTSSSSSYGAKRGTGKAVRIAMTAQTGNTPSSSAISIHTTDSDGSSGSRSPQRNSRDYMKPTFKLMDYFFETLRIEINSIYGSLYAELYDAVEKCNYCNEYYVFTSDLGNKCINVGCVNHFPVKYNNVLQKYFRRDYQFIEIELFEKQKCIHFTPK